MSQSTIQIAVQPRNNNGQIQRPQNIGGPQNVNGQFQRLQNTDNFIANQQHADLVNGVFSGSDPFTRTQDIENETQQNIQFPTMLFLG
ncbi:11186_t:CDS:2, partial [Gigaspora margarita]